MAISVNLRFSKFFRLLQVSVRNQLYTPGIRLSLKSHTASFDLRFELFKPQPT